MTLLTNSGTAAPADIAEAWRRFLAERDSGARQTILVQFAPLVRHVVGRMPAATLPEVDRDDLESAGALGLLRALDRFDPGRNVKFETFAYRWIQGSVLDHLRRLDRLSRGGRKRVEDYKRAVARLRENLGREPLEWEVAEALAVSQADLKGIYQEVVREAELSLDSATNGEEADRPDMAHHGAEPDVLSGLERQEAMQRLREAVEALPPKDKQVVSLYYFDELTFREIADVLEVSESRVCQLHARALKTMEARLVSARSVETEAKP